VNAEIQELEILESQFLPIAILGVRKNPLFCHSEVAAATEESLFGLNAGKERFLGAQRASE